MLLPPTLIALTAGVCVLLVAPPATAQTGENVLVVINSASAASVEIGTYYAQKRAVPARQLLRLTLPLEDEIGVSTFANRIERPVGDWLIQNQAQDRILYIVLTKGVPLRIAGTADRSGTTASVDSELSLLYRKFAGLPVPLAGAIPNPYFAGDTDVAAAASFTHRDSDIYLVTRLDGFTVPDVKALIDRGAAPARQGTIRLTRRLETEKSAGNAWLDRAASRLQALPGWRDAVIHDILRPRSDPPLLGYYTWGSNDPSELLLGPPDLEFVPGALAGMFVSTDARTFGEPPAEWRPGQPFAGSSQSLTGHLIRQGVTGVAGHVAEPFLDAAVRPDVLFPAYLRGLNLAEAFYLAMPFLSWQTVVIGDPLCAPFRQDTLAARDIDPGIDSTTELPQFLSDRRERALTAAGADREAARLFLKAQQRVAFNDREGARQALEAATEIDETFVAAHVMVAGLYEQAALYDAAVDRYHRILAINPNQAVALNNLAYNLAVRRQSPDEALPFARRALAAAPTNPAVADTVGWVYHLLGDHERAEVLLVAAASAAPTNVQILIHAAVVLVANGKHEEAAEALDKARSVDPKIDERDDVRRLVRDLQTPARN